MQTGFVNVLLNPDFSFWDYGNGDFTVTGYTATRWKMTRTGNPNVAVRKGTFSSASNIDKWLRGQSCLEIDVNAIASGENVQIRQNVSKGEKMGRQIFAYTGMISGPDGASVYVGFNNFYRKVKLKGIDVPVRFEIVQTIDDPATLLSADCFTSPSMTGKYRVSFVQLETLNYNGVVSGFELRNPAIDRMLLFRYVYPVTKGLMLQSSTISAFGAVNFPIQMRAVPTYRPLVTSGISLVSLIGGVEAVATNAINQAATNVSDRGARLAIQNGWTSLTNGQMQILNTDVIGIFDADY